MKHQEKLLDIFQSGKINACKDDAITTYCLESFAKDVDSKIQNDLMMRLILDHSAISRQLEALNRELQAREAMLVEAQKIALLGRWDYYYNSGKLVWSSSMYDIVEVDPSIPASSKLFLSRTHPEDYENVSRLYEQLFQIKWPWAVRFRLVMDDGRIKWVQFRCNPTNGGQDDTGHYYGTIQDITEMKKVEDELEKHNHHLEKMVEEKVQEITASQMATIFALIKLSESRDDDTGMHIERTASFCRLLAMKARDASPFSGEIDDIFIATIYKASPLHDIGKVGIPDSILLKPGKLTESEFAIMKTHVTIGYQTLAEVAKHYDKNEFLKMGMDIALYHHEKWDGSGYNAGLSGEQIPLAARIMTIVDVYDALRSKRVYKEGYSHEKSMDIIRAGRGTHFDPLLTDIFCQDHEEFRLLYESLL